jgi:glycosyltransferase involved in cell wall biosynthesis
LTSDGFAGIERHVIQLSRELGRLGYTSELACPPAAVQLRAEAAASGVVVHPRERSRAWIRPVAQEIRSRPPQILHVHDGRAALAGALLARASPAVVVRTQHFVHPASVERPHVFSAASVALHRTLNRKLHGFIAVSEAVAVAARERRETGEAELVVIPPGVEVPSEDALANAKRARAHTEPTVAYVGRLESEKRLETLIHAIPRVRAHVPNCRFVIAGAGAAEADLKSLAQRLGADHAITWPGWVDPGRVLAAAHVYVNTWPREAFGMAMAEAMGYGLPVIAVNAGAIPEMVQDGVNGALVTSGDSGGMADAIVGLASDPDKAAKMGAAGRERAVHLYTVERTAATTRAFYRRLVDKTP